MWLYLLACSSDPKDTTTTDPDAPTWYQDVAPIVMENCTGCHSPAGPGFDLSSYDRASAMAGAMASAVEERRMPPWGAREDENCTPDAPWKDDRRLEASEIETLRAWADAGAPEGDPESAAPTEEPIPAHLEDYDAEFKPVQSYFTQGKADELICFSIDPKATADAWLLGLEVVPGNTSIAHHALVMSDPDGASAALAGADGWYDCGGQTGVGVSNARLFATWVPGAPPTIAPEGTAIPFEANARVILQMHYHPAGVAAAEDLTTLRVKLASSRPQKALYQTLLGNFANESQGLLPDPDDRSKAEFRIPAGSASHTETMEYVVPDGVYNLPLVSFAAHMHLAGTSLSLKVKKGGQESCLLNVPAYDYDWQQIYDYDTPYADAPTVSAGDIVEIKCGYNNTLDNPGIKTALEEEGLSQPVDIYLGEGTLDEMCIAMVGFVY